MSVWYSRNDGATHRPPLRAGTSASHVPVIPTIIGFSGSIGLRDSYWFGGRLGYDWG